MFGFSSPSGLPIWPCRYGRNSASYERRPSQKAHLVGMRRAWDEEGAAGGGGGARLGAGRKGARGEGGVRVARGAQGCQGRCQRGGVLRWWGSALGVGVNVHLDGARLDGVADVLAAGAGAACTRRHGES